MLQCNITKVASIIGITNCTYFFLALSTFDYNLSAHTTQEEYVLTMQRMLEYCYTRSQGFPIVMPLIGAGQSRTGNNERAILEYLIGLPKFRDSMGNVATVHIPLDKETITNALNAEEFMVNTMAEAKQYYYEP